LKIEIAKQGREYLLITFYLRLDIEFGEIRLVIDSGICTKMINFSGIGENK